MVGIYSVNEYDIQKIGETIQNIFNDINIPEKIHENMNVVIKADLTVGIEEKRAYTSVNIAIIKAVAQRIKKLGASVTICDTVDGPYTISNLEQQYEALGLLQLEDIGIKLNRNVNTSKVSLKFEGEDIELNMMEVVRRADYIINIPKFKTHSVFGISGAISNMFNVLDLESIKKLYGKYPDRQKLCKIARIIAENFKNQIVIEDAIFSMEKEGPVNGSLIKLNAIIASDDILEIDYITATNFFNQNSYIPILEEIKQLKGENEALIIDVKKNQKYNYKTLKLPKNLDKLSFFDKLYKKDVWPCIDSKKCIKCKICILRCPMDVIHEKSHMVVMDERFKCTKCMYCVDKCPVGAIYMKKMKVKIVRSKVKLLKEKNDEGDRGENSNG